MGSLRTNGTGGGGNGGGGGGNERRGVGHRVSRTRLEEQGGWGRVASL